MKTPGQKAYEEMARILPESYDSKWFELRDHQQVVWDRIAAAVTAPEPKSYGRVYYEAFHESARFQGSDTWDEYHWKEYAENGALAVIAEFKRRENIK